MAIAFRAIASTAYSAKTNTTVSKPTGTVDGDIMLATLMAGSSVSQAATLAVTPPAGWTLLGTTVSQTQGGGGFHGAFYVYWKRASSEGASYDFTHSTLTTQATVTSYSGCLASGSPVDVFSQNNGLTINSTGTGITTTVANTLLLYLAHNWTGTGLTPPSGMTERFDGICYVSDEARPTAGATGNRTQIITDAVWQVYMVALKPATATAYVINAVPGSYAFTGTAATLTKTTNRTLAAAAGAYVFTGAAATMVKGGNAPIAAVPGSYILAGTAATLTKAGSSGGTPPVFRAASNTTYASRADMTNASKPTGTVDGDIMLAGVFAFYGTADPADITITPPAGWTQVGTETLINGGGGNYGKFFVYWKRASSEGASYDFTHTAFLSYTTQAVIVAYSGALASGSPVDVYSSSTGTGTAATYTGVTTTGGNEKLVLLAHNFTASQTLSPPTGMTERYDHITYAADETIVAAGATGTRTHTVNSSADPWAGFLVALKGGIASGARLIATAGSYTFSGTSATLRLSGNKLAAVSGSYSLTGTPATLFLLTGGLPVFRAVSSSVYEAVDDVTSVAKPVGTVNGDVMIATFLGASSIALDVVLDTPPAGWTLIGAPVLQTQPGGGFHGKLWVYWKRASGEPASYDFLHATTMSTQATISSYSGCIGSGSPVNVFSQAVGVSATATATSVTTTLANTKLIYTGHNWDGTGLTPPSGMTERFDSIVYSADESRVLAGATGARTQALASANPWQAYLIALTGGSALTSYGVTAVPGSYTITGTTVTTGRALIAVAGSYAFTGTPVTMSRGRRIIAVAGDYTFSGSPVTLRRGLSVIATPGSYTFIGVPVTLVASIPAPALSGMSVWTGSAWVDKPVKVWTGSAWLEKPVKVWNGSTWV